MKPIAIPPNLSSLTKLEPQKLIKTLSSRDIQDLVQRSNERYLHWHDFRFRPMPEGITPEVGWAVLKFARMSQSRPIRLMDVKGSPFSYWLPDGVQRELHFIDQNATGQILVDEPIIGSSDRDRYVLNSLMEEAIASSMLEGAATTRKKAKDMLREERKPKSRGEQMVLNNFNTMRRIKELSGQVLSAELLCELQASMTKETLEDTTASGRFRREEEEIHVVDIADGKILHTPPKAQDLQRRIDLLCKFANDNSQTPFIHPVIKGILLHFWLAYDHPFVDGNGRTARALFYWFLLKQKYWLVEYLPISRIILKAPAKYRKAFLYSETDGGDLTYFVNFNVRAFRLSIEDLGLYIARKQTELKQARTQLKNVPGLNHRQVGILQHALRKPDTLYTIRRHMNTHGIVYQTARTDLFELAEKGFFKTHKDGRTYLFYPSDDMTKRLKLTKRG